MKLKSYILPIIVISQFCCTSLWFASNAVMSELIQHFGLQERALGDLTSFVQFGFISGTLLFAVLTIADRYAPSKVFFVCAILGSLSNILVVIDGHSFYSLLTLRFLTGFFLAGIYPVGMKIAADYFDKGLGKSLGYLVGALVLGTAFPHLLKGVLEDVPWRFIVVSTSVLALIGGSLIMFLVPTGPFYKKGQRLDPTLFASVFKNPRFRSAAFGYFGHMWELYAFWAFVPIILTTYQNMHTAVDFNIPILSFTIIAIGFLSCVIGGYLSLNYGTKRVAFIALLLSFLCCLISPFAFELESSMLFVLFLLFWGAVVIADSPLFSTLVAQNAESQIKGTALTIVNCIGFSITIVSIQVITMLSISYDSRYIFLILSIGPFLGLLALSKKIQQKQNV